MNLHTPKGKWKIIIWLGAGLMVFALGMIPLGPLMPPTVSAHGGIDAGQNPFTVWNANPLPTLFLLIAAYLYMTGLSRWQRPSHPVNRWQKASFFAGLFAIFLALQSPLEPLAEHLFSFHQVQHVTLRRAVSAVE